MRPSQGVKTSRSRTRRAAAAGVAGSVIEYYDFAIYGLAAALVFGPVFFPSENSTVSLLASFATFGVGFLARPLGGIVFGQLGDRIGRKKVLIITVALMGGATVLIGCLPGYDTIGSWGAVFLVALRLIQGFAFGGEYGGAILLVAEHADSRRRGLYAALPGAGLSMGLILGNLAFLAVSQMDTESMQTWGWRVPFWAGGLIVIVGLFLRNGVEESPVFTENKKSEQLSANPVRDAFRTHSVEILLTSGILAGVSVTTYVTVTFSLAYATQEIGSATLPLLGILVASVLQLIVVPAAGALSDRIGRIRSFLTGIAVIAAMSLVFIPMVGVNAAAVVITAYVLMYGLGWGILNGSFPSMISEAFDARVRYSGMSIGIQLGNIIGGFTPFVAVMIVTSRGGTLALGLCLVFVVAISGSCGVALVRRTEAKARSAESAPSGSELLTQEGTR